MIFPRRSLVLHPPASLSRLSPPVFLLCRQDGTILPGPFQIRRRITTGNRRCRLGQAYPETGRARVGIHSVTTGGNLLGIAIGATVLPSNCPQDRSRDSKKPWEYSKSTRDAKSLSGEDLNCKLSLCTILQKEGRLNPALSVSSTR